MSFVTLLRAPDVACESKQKKPAKQHLKEGMHLDGQISLADRIVAYLDSEYGSAYTVALLGESAKDSEGSQPSSAIGERESERIVDLTADDDAASHWLTAKRVPY